MRPKPEAAGLDPSHPEPEEAFADLEEVKREKERVGPFRRTSTDRWVVEQMDRDTHAQTDRERRTDGLGQGEMDRQRC